MVLHHKGSCSLWYHNISFAPQGRAELTQCILHVCVYSCHLTCAEDGSMKNICGQQVIKFICHQPREAVALYNGICMSQCFSVLFYKSICLSFSCQLQVRQKTLLELLSLEDEVSKDEWLSMYGGAAHCV